MENTIKQTKGTFRELRETERETLKELFSKCETQAAFTKVFNQILDNNLQTLDQIVSKEKLANKYTDPEYIRSIQQLFETSEEKRKKFENLSLEKDTMILITEQRNKNIEMYYIIYIMFIILLLIIEGSVVIFK